ncbi:kyphoscoliosis peptidase-like [Ylistrum balloti]|uniref:kyphoscoliosis peptidase-like n=1 Tax=Ylistrum balloti TaxID=509963 RepID=UPI002905F733|nr:kyphoscoliosis peptidase-like [Ylistrum balloti]
MGCGSSTDTKPTNSRETRDTVISDVDIDDNFNESSKNKNWSNSSRKSPSHTASSPALTNRRQDLSKHQTLKSTSVDEGIELEALDEEDYPPRPCRLKKSDMIQHPSMFTSIDSHVAKTPKSATTSIPELAKYLCQPAKNRLEKIRAIYQWVSRNIEYDVAGFFNLGGAQRKSCDPESVLRSRSSVCQGYADLFLFLCREARVPAKTISGYAKGYGHKPGVAITTKTDTNHAWNAVFVQNEWRLVDCTWDAGHVDGNTFHRHEGEFYFLTDPDVFINDHFPYNKTDMAVSQQWQLISPPHDLETFSKSAAIKKHAFLYNLEFMSHRDAVITVNKDVIVKFVAKGKALKNTGAHLNDMEGTSFDQCVFVEKERDKTYCVTVKPQKPGTYNLRIFGNQGEQQTLDSLVTYVIECKTVDKAVKSFPVHFGLWGAGPYYADFGFDDRVAQKALFESDSGELEIRLPFTEPVKALGKLANSEDENGDDQFLMMEQGQSELLVHVRMNRLGFYKLLIFAKKEKSASYDLALQYLINCKNPGKQYQAFPHVYPEALAGRMTLVEPKTRSLPAETKVHFRLSSSVIDTLMIGHTTFERGVNNTWDVDVVTPSSGENLCVFGRSSNTGGGSFTGLYKFDIR